jgi:hypothetical protein
MWQLDHQKGLKTVSRFQLFVAMPQVEKNLLEVQLLLVLGLLLHLLRSPLLQYCSLIG